MNHICRILIGLLLATLAPAVSLAQAPPPNPVFVNDSAEAARMLRQARSDAIKNPSESIRLIQEILDEHGRMLHPDDDQAGRFISVRQDAIELLSSSPDLWKRYEAAEAKQANRLLEEGRLRRLVETRSVTTAGLEAILILSQWNLEMGRLATATSYLKDAFSHPQLTDRDRWSALMMSGMAAHASGRFAACDNCVDELEEAGEAASPWLDALQRVRVASPPAIRSGRDAIERSLESLGQTTWPALWTREFERVPATITIQNEFDSDRVDQDLAEGRLTTVMPSIVGNRIVLNEGGDVVEVDLLTGQEIWRTSILDEGARSARIDDPIGPTCVAVDEDDVITWTGYSRESGVSETDDVVCLDFETGMERWRFNLSEIVGIDDSTDLYPAGPAVIHEDRVLLLMRRERRQKLKSVYLLALDRLDGTLVFTTYIASTSSQSDGLRPLTMPVVDGSDVLVSTSIGAIASVDIASGRIKWLQRMATPISSTLATSRVRPYQLHRPIVFDDQVISLTPDYRSMVRLDRETGRILQRISLDTRLDGSPPAYLLSDGERVFVIGSSITAFDSGDLSEPIWTNWPRSGSRNTPLPGRVHVAGDQLLVPTGDELLFVDGLSGQLVDSIDLKGSSLPMISNGHLLLTDPSGMSLHADTDIMAEALSERLTERPMDLEAVLSTARLSARSGDTRALLDWSARLTQVIGADDDTRRTRTIRRLLFDELRDQIETAAFDWNDAPRIQRILDSLTVDTPLEASAKIAMADWQMNHDMPAAIVQWQTLSSDPLISNQLHEENGVLAPAGEWARNRLSMIEETYPELMMPSTGQDIDASSPWKRRLADLAFDLRSGKRSTALDTRTLETLEDSLRRSRAHVGLQILDLWSTAREGDDVLPDGQTRSQWRQRLLESELPDIPRGEVIGGQSLRWPGILVPALDASSDRSLSRTGFLRSFEDTVTWHEGAGFEPRWTRPIPGRECSIVWQDDGLILLQIAELGRPRTLICLSLTDGGLQWDMDLPEDAFVDEMPPVGGDVNQSPLNTASWIAVEPVEDRLVLIHQDGRAIAVDPDSDAAVVWSSQLPDHFIQDHAPWQNGVAVIGYRSIDIKDPWLNRGPREGDMILGWFDADTGEVLWRDLPTQIGAASWLESNDVGDLIVGGTTGAALYRTPGEGPSWISQDRSLHINRMLDGIELTSRVLQTTNLKYDRTAFSLRTGRKLDLEALPERSLRTGIPMIRRHGDSQSLVFDKMILILDSQGRVTGSNAGTRALNHRLDESVAFSDGIVLLDRIDPRLHSTAGRSSARNFYQVQVIAPDGKGVEILDLFPLDSRIRAGRAMRDSLLLTTEEEVLAITLPPAIDAP